MAEYVKHETALWDFKKRPLKDPDTFFQKEMVYGHPVAKHYLSLTKEQRKQIREWTGVRNRN